MTQTQPILLFHYHVRKTFRLSAERLGRRPKALRSEVRHAIRTRHYAAELVDHYRHVQTTVWELSLGLGCSVFYSVEPRGIIVRGFSDGNFDGDEADSNGFTCEATWNPDRSSRSCGGRP